MANIPERRHNARLTIPPQFSDPGLADQQVRLVDLSPDGACLEHSRPFADWDPCFLTLPPALGGIRLQGEVIWSRVGGRTPGAEGNQLVYYQSGLHFTYLTPEQQAGLMAALESIRAAQGISPLEQPSGTTGEAPSESGKTATGRA